MPQQEGQINGLPTLDGSPNAQIVSLQQIQFWAAIIHCCFCIICHHLLLATDNNGTHVPPHIPDVTCSESILNGQAKIACCQMLKIVTLSDARCKESLLSSHRCLSVMEQ